MEHKPLPEIGPLVWIGGAAGLMVVLLLGLWLHTMRLNDSFGQTSSANAPSRPMTDQENGEDQARMGIMTPAEGTRWTQLLRTVKHRGSITPPELNWVLQTLAAPAPSLPPDIPQRYLAPQMAATRRLELMLVLREAKSCTPAQKERIYQATVGYLSSQEPNDEVGAIAVMRTLKDSRAIPKIRLLLSDPNEPVRTHALAALAAIPETGR